MVIIILSIVCLISNHVLDKGNNKDQFNMIFISHLVVGMGIRTQYEVSYESIEKGYHDNQTRKKRGFLEELTCEMSPTLAQVLCNALSNPLHYILPGRH